MVDEDIVRKKLAFIETCLVELKTLARPDAFRRMCASGVSWNIRSRS